MKTKVIWLIVGVVLNWNINVMKAQFNKGNKAMQYWGNGAMWITKLWGYDIKYYIQSMKDTIIQGKKYYNISGPLIYSQNGILLEDSINYVKLKYYNHAWWNDIYFDFSKQQVGDTTQTVIDIFNGINDKYVVDSIWQESDGVKYYTFYRIYDPSLFPYPYWRGVWVKNIGSLDGGFLNFGYRMSPEGVEYCGACFSYNDTIRYLNIPPYSKWNPLLFGMPSTCRWIGSVVSIRGRCDTLSAFKGKIVGVNMLEQAEEWVSIYPNPVSDVLNIESMESTMDIVLYNISGEVVKRINFHGEKLHIPMQDIPPGFYLMELKLDNTKIIRRKIVKR